MSAVRPLSSTKTRLAIITLGAAAAIAAFAGPSEARKAGVIPDRSGNAPEYKSCMEAGCHDTAPSIKTVVIGSLRVEGLPPEYDPTVTYTVKLIANASVNSIKKWGFQATFLLDDNKKAGTLTVSDADRSQIKTGADREFMTHKITNAGTAGKDGTIPLAADAVGTCTWTFKWKPPAKGRVRLFAAAVLGDGDEGRKNDIVYTLSTSLGTLIAVPPLEGGEPDAEPEDPGKRSGLDETGVLFNRPNPFGPSTVIEYSVPQAGAVSLLVFDVQGARVRTLEDGSRTAGRHVVTWDGRTDDGRSVAAGTYFYRLQIGERVEVRKMTLVE